MSAFNTDSGETMSDDKTVIFDDFETHDPQEKRQERVYPEAMADADAVTVISQYGRDLIEKANPLRQRIAALEAESAELAEALNDMYLQYECGCGYPACKCCQYDRMCRSILAKRSKQK